MAAKTAEGMRTGDLIALAGVLAAGTVAYGDSVVRFENTGFGWFQNTLDLTKPADQQNSPIGTGTAIYMDYFGDFYPTFSYAHTYQTGGGAEVASAGFNNQYAQPLAKNTMIGAVPGTSWTNRTNFEFAFTQCDYYYPYDCTDGTRGIIPEGVRTYLGVRMDIAGQDYFGWIAIERSGAFIDVFAWGYETDPNTPIAAGIPSPGALGMLAFGVAAGSLRRTRRDEA